jgi:hypothetical protein
MASMGAAGFTVAAGQVGMAGTALASRVSTSTVQAGTGSASRIAVAGTDNFDITTSGEQTLSFTFNGNAVQYGANGQVKFGMHKSSQSRIVSVEFMKLAVEGDQDASPITLDSGGVRFVADPDSEFAPASSEGELRLSKLVVPALAGSPLGAKIDTLSTTLFFQTPLPSADPSNALQPWLGQPDALALPTVSLTWGTLKLTGVGAVGLDGAGRPAGRFEVRVADVLGMLDSFHARGQFDRNQLAKTYASPSDDGRVGTA